MNNGRIVNRTLLGRYFSLLPGINADKIRTLLYPQDPQNVPCAVELLQTVIKLRGLMYPDSVTPTIAADMDAFCLLAELLESILAPFTNVELSLTDQVQSLAKYAHLSFTLFRSHRDGLMSNQLYGDSQTMVKNCIFCIAKQKLLDDSRPFYIFRLGTDRLETFFGRVRMLGSHDCTMNYRQAIERFGHAVDVDCILEDHPEWDTGSRRLKMTRVEHVDHLNAESWKGSLVVHEVDLLGAWLTGRDAAVKVLEASQLPRESFDYTNLFTGTVDTLRPWGGNSYPGVSTDVDRSLVIEDGDEIFGDIPDAPVSENVHTSTTSDGNMATIEPFTQSTSPHAEDDDFCLWEESLADAPKLVDPSNDFPSTTVPLLAQPEDYLEHNGQMVHKQTFCRLYLSRDSPHLSHDRLSRWRGFNSAHKPALGGIDVCSIENTEEALGNNLVVGDLVATLLRSDSCISLAVLTVTAINQGTSLLPDVDLDQLMNERHNIKLAGQVLSLIAIPAVTLVPDMTASSQDSVGTDLQMNSTMSTWSWLWAGGYIKTKSSIAGTDEVMEKSIVVNVPGHLTTVLNPQIICADRLQHLPLTENEHSQLNSKRLLWMFDNGGLGLVRDTLWERISTTETAPGSVTLVKPLAGFPYQLAGDPGLVCELGSNILKADQFRGVDLVRNCHFCAQKIDGAPKWRSHIGEHILRKILNVSEPSGLLKEPVRTLVVLRPIFLNC